MRRWARILRWQFYRNTFIENTEEIYFISSLKWLIRFLFSINCQTIFDTCIRWKKYFLTMRLVIFLACSDTRWTEFNKVRSHPTHFPREFVRNKAAWKWTFPSRFCHIFSTEIAYPFVPPGISSIFRWQWHEAKIRRDPIYNNCL